MSINLTDYGNALAELMQSYEKQRNRLDAYNRSHFTFSDGTQVAWSPAEQTKALTEAQADVTALEATYAKLKTALGML